MSWLFGHAWAARSQAAAAAAKTEAAHFFSLPMILQRAAEDPRAEWHNLTCIVKEQEDAAWKKGISKEQFYLASNWPQETIKKAWASRNAIKLRHEAMSNAHAIESIAHLLELVRHEAWPFCLYETGEGDVVPQSYKLFKTDEDEKEGWGNWGYTPMPVVVQLEMAENESGYYRKKGWWKDKEIKPLDCKLKLPRKVGYEKLVGHFINYFREWKKKNG